MDKIRSFSYPTREIDLQRTYLSFSKGEAVSSAKAKKIIKVKVASANQLLEEVLGETEYVDIVKIDVEGYEYRALLGFSKNIRLILR